VLGGTPLPAAEVQAMTTGKAADFIKLNCQGILQAYKETGPIPSFLYRGEDVNRPSLLKCLPDLMDPTTYVEGKEAAEFFGKMESAMKDLPVKYVSCVGDGAGCVGGWGCVEEVRAEKKGCMLGALLTPCRHLRCTYTSSSPPSFTTLSLPLPPTQAQRRPSRHQ
jgi:hypothetical protein